MKYFEVKFTLTPCSQVAQDLLSALAGEAGFETFEETETGLTGYVQQSLFVEAALEEMLACFPLEDTQIRYDVHEAEDRDWNEQWEQQGFEPIEVKGKTKDGRGKTLIIHDGRHLPSAPSDIMIEIDAHLAFGTGTHETTQMICSILLDTDLEGMRVLDCGCGTGILGICALKLGAASCTAYDIDEWSIDNTRHNAVINHVDQQLTPLHGDASVLNGFTAEFDVIMANINRNILLQDMERFASVMAPQATLVLSGFYKSDGSLLVKKAHSLGLTLKQSKMNGEWNCLMFNKQ
jgi:ribosomal protein L11 methyltransferase